MEQNRTTPRKPNSKPAEHVAKAKARLVYLYRLVDQTWAANKLGYGAAVKPKYTAVACKTWPRIEACRLPRLVGIGESDGHQTLYGNFEHRSEQYRLLDSMDKLWIKEPHRLDEASSLWGLSAGIKGDSLTAGISPALPRSGTDPSHNNR